MEEAIRRAVSAGDFLRLNKQLPGITGEGGVIVES
jgi:hypothetical protein